MNAPLIAPPPLVGIQVDEQKLDQIQARVLDASWYSRQPVSFQGVTIRPYSPVVGGWVTGLRLGPETEISPDLARFLHDHLVQFGFLSFEPGTVDSASFERLIGAFGAVRLMNTPYTPERGKKGQLNAIDSSIKKTRMNYIPHIDQAFQPTQPRFTALHAVQAPDQGGDTVFVNAVAAHALLDSKLVEYLETLTAVHDVETQGFLTLAYHDLEERRRQREKYPPIEVPLFRTHPDTGARQIFANELYTQRILGVTRRTSQALLDILFDALSAPEIQTRHQWRDGVALIWDNRVVQHRGVADFGGKRRVLQRALVI